MLPYMLINHVKSVFGHAIILKLFLIQLLELVEFKIHQLFIMQNLAIKLKIIYQLLCLLTILASHDLKSALKLTTIFTIIILLFKNH